MFLLIERDPFVRTDMGLTLTEAFPQVAVVSLGTIEAARREAYSLSRPRLVLLDTLPLDPDGAARLAGWQSDRTPVLLTNASGSDDEAGHPKLPRPFTAQMLVEAVQAALRTMA
jgi:DNA-binding response OmpR family regulator